MRRDAQRLGLWIYRQASKLGLLSSRPGQRLFNRAYFAYKRQLEDPFHALTQRHPEFFTGGHAIDVGANIGYTACVFAKAIERPFKVWAFEPEAQNFSRLEATVAEQHLKSQVTAIRSAIGDEIGTASLALNEFQPGDHQIRDGTTIRAHRERLEPVDMTSVDEAARALDIFPVAFIKVDVQGYELRVCRGMSRTLEVNPAAIVVMEYCPAALRQYGAQPRELTDFFLTRGYVAYRVTQRGTLEPLDATSPPEDLPPPGYIDILFTRELRGASM